MSEGFERLLVRKEDDERAAETEPTAAPALLQRAMDELMKNERDALIMRLRAIEDYLIDRGILKEQTIPRRNR